MSAYVLGSLVGRFVLSALIVYIIILLFKRFNARDALRKMKSPWSLMGVLLVFVLGLAGSAHAAESSAASGTFDIKDFPKAGLQVHVPSKPAWNVQTEARRDAEAILLSTPQNHTPLAVIEMTLLKNMKVNKKELRDTAVTALNTGRKNGGIRGKITGADLKSVKYGKIEGYLDQYEISAGGQTYTMNSIMAVLPNNKPILLSLLTQKGKTAEVELTANQIWSQLKELQ